MSGHAIVEVQLSLLELLKREPYCDQVEITHETYVGDGFYIITVISSLLPDNCPEMQNIIIEDGVLRFKADVDSDLR
jgi:hypothetical protein